MSARTGKGITWAYKTTSGGTFTDIPVSTSSAIRDQDTDTAEIPMLTEEPRVASTSATYSDITLVMPFEDSSLHDALIAEIGNIIYWQRKMNITSANATTVTEEFQGLVQKIVESDSDVDTAMTETMTIKRTTVITKS